MFFREQAIIRQILTTGSSSEAGEGVTIHMGEKRAAHRRDAPSVSKEKSNARFMKRLGKG